MVIQNTFTDKIIVISQTRWFWAKVTFIQAMCHKLEKHRLFSRLPKCNQFQSCPFVSIRASFSSRLFVLHCSTVLSGYCNVPFYFLSILGVMELHHFMWHSPFKSQSLAWLAENCAILASLKGLWLKNYISMISFKFWVISKYIPCLFSYLHFEYAKWFWIFCLAA